MPSAWQWGGAAALPATVAESLPSQSLWRGAHGWNMCTYRIFRKDKQRRAGGVMLYLKELLDYSSIKLEICLLRVSGWRPEWGGTWGDVVIGVSYRLQAMRRWGLRLSASSKSPTWSPCPRWGFQPPGCLLEEQHGSRQAIQEVLRVQWWHFPNTNARGAVMAFCLMLAWPPAEEQGRSGGESGHRALLGLQQPRGDRCGGEPGGWAADWLIQKIACGKQPWRGRVPRRTNWFLKRTYRELMHESPCAGAWETSADSPFGWQGPS